LPTYRLYLIHHLPALRVLDFQKVTRKERVEASKRFESAHSAAQALKDIREREAALEGAGEGVGKKRKAANGDAANEEEVCRRIAELEKRIEAATSMEEV
jgi:U2 small nuclear ribonucleoprotein A'